MHFAHASYLLYLVVAFPVVTGLVYLGYLSRKAARDAYGDADLVDRFSRPMNRRHELLRGLALVASAAMLLLALAQPMAPKTPDQVRSGSMQIVAVYDVSWSAECEDYRGLFPGSMPGTTVMTGESGSRLDMAHYLTLQIMQATRGNEIGLVTYMGNGFPLFDLTSSYDGLRIVMDNGLFPGNAPGGGSDISQGLTVAAQMFKRAEHQDRQKVIVLFSDGGFDGKQQDLQNAIALLKSMHIRLVVVGLGSHTEQPIPIYDLQTGVFQGYRKLGPNDRTSINESFLRQLASDANGEYHYVPPGNTKLDIQWSTALGGTRVEPQSKPLYYLFVGGAFALLVLISLPALSRKRDAQKGAR